MPKTTSSAPSITRDQSRRPTTAIIPRRPILAILAALATLLALAPIALTSGVNRAGADGPGCADGPLVVSNPNRANNLASPWYPASWSGTVVDTSGPATGLFFPLRWSAFSTATPPRTMTGCEFITFDLSTSTGGNPGLALRLNNRNGDAGSVALNQSAFVSGGTITSTAKRVRVPLERFDLPTNEVTRFSLINNSGRGNLRVEINNIAFTGAGTDPMPQPDPDPPVGTVCRKVFDDDLDQPWYPSSWTVNNQRITNDITATFPRRWGAVSLLTTNPVNVTGCQQLAFDISLAANSPGPATFDVRLNTLGSAVAGNVEGVASGVNQTVRTVVVDLNAFAFTNNQVTRISIVNRSTVEGVRVRIDNIRFLGTGAADPNPDPDPEPNPDPQPDPDPGPIQAIDYGFNWGDDPGVDGEINSHLPTDTFRVDQQDQPARPNDNTDDTAGFKAAIAAARANGDAGGVILVPPGTWHISEPLRLIGNRIVLRGSGTDRSTIVFRNRADGRFGLFGNLAGPGVNIRPAQDNLGLGRVNVIAGRHASRQLTVTETGVFAPGSFAQILDASGTNAYPSAAGQIVKIDGVTNNGGRTVLTLERQLGLDYGSGFVIEPIPMAQHSGVEDLTLRAEDPLATNVNEMVFLDRTANSFVRNIDSFVPISKHVGAYSSYRCEISGGHFDNAQNHGDGGEGYGVNVAARTSHCLVRDNTFLRLRHSMLLHDGATANVMAFNHSRDPLHPNFGNGGPNDISFHGYSVANLVENNVVQRIVISDAGAAGPYNHIFRNCVTTSQLSLANRANRSNVFGNAMFGTLADLRRPDRMPTFRDRFGGAEAQPYDTFGSDGLFSGDGVDDTVGDPTNRVFANWHVPNGSAPPNFAALPSSYFGANNPVLAQRTGNVNTDCSIPALSRLGPL